eukprot:TRINITY_DN2422_c0_g1_i7.p1 TRINITY_DN2422_c0_g1~~TRINITY_DN2422_c0_g1_i7.p1  ORF type:complete len:645 (-),score=110.77 TRINITY_DN2422_c0_g1_i7:745-2598(-)
MNQTAGPRGLVPTLLVFGVIPRMPVTPLPLPSQLDLVRAIATAGKEMSVMVARARVRKALSTNVPAAANRDINPGSDVLVYREPPVDQWEGPYTAVAARDKMVWIAMDGILRPFGVDKVKPHLPPFAGSKRAPRDAADEPAPTADVPPHVPTAPPGGPLATARAGIHPAAPAGKPPSAGAARSGSPPVATPPGLVDAPPTVPGEVPANTPDDLGHMLDAAIAGEHLLSTVHAATSAFVANDRAVAALVNRGRHSRGRKTPTGARLAAAPLSARVPGNSCAEDHVTEAIPPGDPRIATAQFQAAAAKEVDGLMARDTFRKVHGRDLPRGANVLGGRMVCTIKNVGTPDEAPKARYVAQGNRDQAKQFVVHNLATLRQRSTRVLTSTAANLGLRLFADDITQAYLQSEEKFTRRIYLRPRPADRHLFGLEEGELLLILRPLYGVCDAGDYWHATLSKHIEEDLSMTPLVSDPAMYFKRDDVGGILGLLAAYVDDVYMAGNGRFQKQAESTLQRFEAKRRKFDAVEFVGVSVATLPGTPRTYTLHQPVYTDRLVKLPTDATYKAFISARASLGWLAHTRPDLCCGINKLAQVIEQAFGNDAIREYNALVKLAKAAVGQCR